MTHSLRRRPDPPIFQLWRTAFRPRYLIPILIGNASILFAGYLSLHVMFWCTKLLYRAGRIGYRSGRSEDSPEAILHAVIFFTISFLLLEGILVPIGWKIIPRNFRLTRRLFARSWRSMCLWLPVYFFGTMTFLNIAPMLIFRSPKDEFQFIIFPALFAYLLFGSHLIGSRIVRRRSRRLYSRCRKCGYDLHGNTSTRCPECGQTLRTVR